MGDDPIARNRYAYIFGIFYPHQFLIFFKELITEKKLSFSQTWLLLFTYLKPKTINSDTGTKIIGVSMLSHNHFWLIVTPWTVAHQAPLSMGFFRQKYWGGLPLPSPGDHPTSQDLPVSPVLVGQFFTTEPHGKPNIRFGFPDWYSKSFLFLDCYSKFDLVLKKIVRNTF